MQRQLSRIKSAVLDIPKEKKVWVPYEDSWTETPVLGPFRNVLPYWYRLRNRLVRSPLFLARFPNIPCMNLLPTIVKSWHRSLTLGELLFMIPLLAGTVAFCVLAIVLEFGVGFTGSVAGWPVIVVFALGSRNSVFTFLLGIPFERALFWHKMIGRFVVVSLSWIHGARAIIVLNSGVKAGVDPYLKYVDQLDHGHLSSLFPATPPLSGLILGGIFLLFPILSISIIRRRTFTLFYIFHILLILLAVVFSIAHGYGSIIIGFLLWVLDVILRYAYLANLSAPRKATAVRLPANVIRISFKQPEGAARFRYTAGQYVFLMVPELTVFEWHPFTISSAPHHDDVSLHIRVLGNWTRALYDLIDKKGGGPVEISAFWEGPYGSPALDIEGDKYKLFLLISGGIGITPMQSITNSLLYQHEEEGRPIKKIWFVWSCADKYMVNANFPHDADWMGFEHQPKLPLSFQPNMLGTRLHTDASLRDKRRRKSSRVSGDPSSIMRSMSVDSNILHTEFFLTRVREKASMASANIHPDLQPFVQFGRPKLPAIFAAYREYAKLEKESRVAVLVCGPGPLVDSVRSECGQGGDVAFDFHSETFAF